jgi:hypothetical protein
MDLSEAEAEEEEDIDDRKRDHKMDTVERQKQVIYWANFLTKKRRTRTRPRNTKVNVFIVRRTNFIVSA